MKRQHVEETFKPQANPLIKKSPVKKGDELKEKEYFDSAKELLSHGKSEEAILVCNQYENRYGISLRIIYLKTHAYFTLKDFENGYKYAKTLLLNRRFKETLSICKHYQGYSDNTPLPIVRLKIHAYFGLKDFNNVYYTVEKKLLEMKYFEEVISICSEYENNHELSPYLNYLKAYTYFKLNDFQYSYDICNSLLGGFPQYNRYRLPSSNDELLQNIMLLKIALLKTRIEQALEANEPLLAAIMLSYIKDLAETSLLHYRKLLANQSDLSRLYEEIKFNAQTEYINNLANIITKSTKLNFSSIEDLDKKLLSSLRTDQEELIKVDDYDISQKATEAIISRQPLEQEVVSSIKSIYSLIYNTLNIIALPEVINIIIEYRSAPQAPAENLLLNILENIKSTQQKELILKALLKVFCEYPKWLIECINLSRADPSRKTAREYLEQEVFEEVIRELLADGDKREDLKQLCIATENDPTLKNIVSSYKRIAFPKGYDEPQSEFTTDIAPSSIEQTPVTSTASAIQAISLTQQLNAELGKERDWRARQEAVREAELQRRITELLGDPLRNTSRKVTVLTVEGSNKENNPQHPNQALDEVGHQRATTYFQHLATIAAKPSSSGPTRGNFSFTYK